MSAVSNVMLQTPDSVLRVYVGTPLGAPTREGILQNYRRACYAVRQLIDEGCAPIAPHLLYCLVLDEQDPTHRSLGIYLDLALMPGFQKVVLFTPDGTPATLSLGMKLDLCRASGIDRLRLDTVSALDAEALRIADRLIDRGLPVEYRILPEVPPNWSPSFLTPNMHWLENGRRGVLAAKSTSGGCRPPGGGAGA